MDPAPRLRANPRAARQLATVRRNRRTRPVAAVLVMILGVICVVSVFSPPLRDRLELLLEILPFAVLHTAATTTVFAGSALIMTARGWSTDTGSPGRRRWGCWRRR